MDVFSCGCIIAEIMLDGQKIFEKEAYPMLRKGKYPLMESLGKIEDEGIRKLIESMLVVSGRKDMGYHLEMWEKVVGSEDGLRKQ